MREPYLSEFKALIQGGAASRDVHDARSGSNFAAEDGNVDEPYLMREVERASAHAKATIPMFASTVGRAPRILDFGCGTGGTTVALALDQRLAADEVLGVDANADALRAAELRARGHDLAAPRIRFQRTEPGQPLPFADGSFDLVITVSVLEFISNPASREQVVDDLRRVVAPGGHLFIATTRPALREHHSKQWFADVRRVDGMPWASPPWHLSRWARGWERLPIPLPTVAGQIAARTPAPRLAAGLMRLVQPIAGAWQRLLIRRPSDR